MTVWNILRFLSAIVVFAAVFSATTSNVCAQPKNLKNLSDAQPDKQLSKELNDIYFNKQIADATAAINLKPDEVSGYFTRGRVYFELKKYDEALRDFDKIDEINKNSDDTHILRGYTNLLRKQFDEALNDFNKALEISPKDEYALETREIVRSAIIEEIAAIKRLDNLIVEKPNNPNLYASRAESYKRIGKKKEAEADRKKSAELNAILKKDVAAECAATDYDCQIRIYNEQLKVAVEMDEERLIIPLYSGRAVSFYKQGNLDDALEDLSKAIGDVVITDSKGKNRYRYSQTGTTRDYYYRGKILFRQGKLDDALSDFRKSANPNLPDGFADIGEIYLIKKDYDKALANYERAIVLNRRNTKAYLGRGTLYLKRGDDFRELENDESKAVEAYRNAVKDFDSVIDIDLLNVNSEVYEKRAKAYEKLNEPDKAAADRAKAEEIAEKP